ncbi:MAG: Wzz/FepE/Etk N-terminal domain-containing protein [Gammaproteobacteria bacterium]
MYELLDQLLNYLRGIWRFRWYALGLAWVVVLVGWAIVFRLPDQFQASARVYVDTDSILRPLLRGLAVQTNVDQRLQIMTRTLLSRPNLQKVARMADLDITAKTPSEMEDLIDRLSRSIHIQGTRRQNLYTISYENSKPEVAKRVVQSLLTLFVENTLGESRQDSSNAQQFLDQQIRDYEQRLVEAENRLMEFKRRNVGFLPNESGDYFDRLQAAQQKLAQAQLALREAENQRIEVKRQLKKVEGTDSLATLGGAGTRGAVSTSVDSRIQTLQSHLDQLRLKFTDKYPDVIETKRLIASLKAQRKKELKALAELPDAGDTTDPLYQQRKLALDQADANIAAIKTRVSAYQDDVNRLKKLVNTLPKVETELKRLNRNYSINKKNYDALVARRESAQLSQDAKETGDGVKFRVIDPPRVPLTPSGPNRLLFSSLVLLGALVAGIAIAFLLSQIRPVVYDRRTLRDLSGLPVFGTVSRIQTAAVLLKRRLDLVALVSASVLLTTAYGVVIWLTVGPGGSIKGLLHPLKGLL